MAMQNFWNKNLALSYARLCFRLHWGQCEDVWRRLKSSDEAKKIDVFLVFFTRYERLIGLLSSINTNNLSSYMPPLKLYKTVQKHHKCSDKESWSKEPENNRRKCNHLIEEVLWMISKKCFCAIFDSWIATNADYPPPKHWETYCELSSGIFKHIKNEIYISFEMLIEYLSQGWINLLLPRIPLRPG